MVRRFQDRIIHNNAGHDCVPYLKDNHRDSDNQKLKDKQYDQVFLILDIHFRCNRVRNHHTGNHSRRMESPLQDQADRQTDRSHIPDILIGPGPIIPDKAPGTAL